MIGRVLSWDALIGFGAWLFVGYCFCVVLLVYHDRNKEVNRAAIRGALAVAMIWLFVYAIR